MEQDAPLASGGNPAPPAVDVEDEPRAEPRFSAIVYLRGEHDMATAPQVADAITKISGSVLIDLSDCDFIDSIIIGTLFDHARRIEKDGHVLEIVAPLSCANVARTLELVRMHELVPVHPARPTIEPSRSTTPGHPADATGERETGQGE
jgi:anti-anti-sigma factor